MYQDDITPCYIDERALPHHAREQGKWKSMVWADLAVVLAGDVNQPCVGDWRP